MQVNICGKFYQTVIKTLILAFITVYCAFPAYSEELNNQIINVTPGNTIINLSINDKLYYDYEVYINSNGTFSLPFKSVAGLLDIPCSQNHLTKNINFTLEGGKAGLINYEQQKIYIRENIIEFKKNSLEKIVYLKDGLMDATKDELFIPVSVLNKILNVNIKPDMSNYSVSITTNKLIKALVVYGEKEKEQIKEKSKNEYSLGQIILPEKKSSFSLDTIELDNSSLYNVNKGGGQSLNDTPFSNYTQVSFDGSLFGGNYVISSNARNTEADKLFFGGVNANYKKEFEKHNLELGEISGESFDDYVIGKGILGIDFNTFIKDNTNYRDLAGKINTGSKVNVYLNDKLFSTLSTIAGYYNLHKLPEYKEKVYKLKLEEVYEDGKTKIIKEKIYPKTEGLLPEGKSKYAVMTGVTGYDNRFFNDYTYNKNRSKKIAEGIKYSYGLTDKITLNAAGIMDNIISMPSEENLSNNYNIDKNILSLALGNSRDFNAVYGQTGLFSANYVPCDPFRIDLDLGLSHQTSKIKSDDFNIGSMGYLSKLSAKYNKHDYALYSSLYDYTPDFYLAGSSDVFSSSSLVNDRIGGKIGGNVFKKFISLDGEYNKYYTNLDKLIPGGKFSFNEYNYNLRIPVKYLSDLSFYNNYKIGKNSTGKITNNTYKVNLNKKLTGKLDLSLTGSLNKFDTQYNETSDSINRGYSSDFWLFSTRLGYDIPKNLGNINLEHEIVKVVAENSNVQQVGYVIPLTSTVNKYNVFRVGYTFPMFWNLSPSFALGYHYTGLNKGLDYTAALAYTFKTGRRLEFNYQYNRQAGSFLDDIFIPTSSRHSFNVNLTDAIGIIGDNLKSIGYADKNNGYIEAIAFLDTNKNGIKDKDEPCLPNITFNFAGTETASTTNKKGVFITEGLPEGFYKVKLDMNKLPSLLSVSSASKDEYLARVDKNKLTKVYFGLLSAVGNITGTVKIFDEFNRETGIKDLVVGVFDEKENEVSYTTINDDGSFYISGLSPGKYTVGIDKDFINAYGLSHKGDEKTKNIVIPAVYDNFVDIKDINLEYTKPSSIFL